MTRLLLNLLASGSYRLTAVLVYRFILDLQEANEHNLRIGSGDPELHMSGLSSQSSLNFVDRALDSLASTIVPGAARSDDQYYNEDISEEGLHSEEVAANPDAIALHDLVLEARAV